MNKEFQFFLRSDLKKYRGRYIAIVGHKVAASGYDAKKVWEQARQKYPNQLLTLAKLPKSETLVCLGLSQRSAHAFGKNGDIFQVLCPYG
ncbi:MAG: hypothetical protein HY747_10800 [Elusimicrobia bacterium]|nr:hypothetical protein [Elusimicrobiota bacterium]